MTRYIETSVFHSTQNFADFRIFAWNPGFFDFLLSHGEHRFSMKNHEKQQIFIAS